MQIVTMRALCILFSTFLAQSSWATSIDARVIEVVLTHFAGRTDAMSSHEQGIVLVDRDTFPWTRERIRFFTLDQRPNQKCDIAPSLFDALVDRNTAVGSSAPMLAQSKRWRVVQSSETKSSGRFLDLTSSGEPIKTIASLSSPAYSANGDTALVIFLFRWSMHRAIAEYILKRSDNNRDWSVQCSDLVFYP